MPKQLLTVGDLCELLSCRRSYIYQLVHNQQIPYIKMSHRAIRFRTDAIDKWLTERTHGETLERS